MNRLILFFCILGPALSVGCQHMKSDDFVSDLKYVRTNYQQAARDAGVPMAEVKRLVARLDEGLASANARTLVDTVRELCPKYQAITAEVEVDPTPDMVDFDIRADRLCRNAHSTNVEAAATAARGAGILLRSLIASRLGV